MRSYKCNQGGSKSHLINILREDICIIKVLSNQKSKFIWIIHGLPKPFSNKYATFLMYTNISICYTKWSLILPKYLSTTYRFRYSCLFIFHLQERITFYMHCFLVWLYMKQNHRHGNMQSWYYRCIMYVICIYWRSLLWLWCFNFDIWT